MSPILTFCPTRQRVSKISREARITGTIVNHRVTCNILFLYDYYFSIQSPSSYLTESSNGLTSLIDSQITAWHRVSKMKKFQLKCWTWLAYESAIFRLCLEISNFYSTSLNYFASNYLKKIGLPWIIRNELDYLKRFRLFEKKKSGYLK